MKKIEYNKLVRDKIPEIIQADKGRRCVTSQLDHETYERLLREKLVEEALEVLDATDRENLYEELADVMEVLYTIMDVNYISEKKLRSCMAAKAERNGALKRRIFLHSVINDGDRDPYVDGKNKECP